MLERLAPGTRIGDLRIERELGQGAFGRVYVAGDALIGRQVALKVIQATRESEESEGRAVILREARAVGKLSSPHIVTLFRVHPPAPPVGAWMFEFEFVEGGSLDDLLRRDGKLPPERVREIARGVADALRVAHAANVVHGDVKPGNVLLARDGTAKLADFGLARVLGDPNLSFSSTNELAGTPVYMAPEVVMGERPTAASDLWSLGVVLYRALAGRPPFRGQQLPSLFYAIQQADPSPLPDGVPDDLAALVLHCLAKLPSERPRSAEEVRGHLDARASRAPAAAPVPPARPRRVELVGREREVAHLSELVTKALAGKGAAVLLTGDAGIGKSAVAREVHELARRGGCRWVEAPISPVRGLLRPLLEAVRALVDDERLAADTQLFGSAADVVAKLLAEESSLKLESRSQALWALENLLAGLTGDPPLAVLVEDAHHADRDETEVLRHLARTLPGKHAFLLVTARTAAPGGTDSAVTHALAPLAEVAHVHLEPLSHEDTYRLVQRWADTPHIAPEISQRVLEVSQGNPLFALELLRHLERAGAVATERGMLRPTAGWGRARLARRFQELAASRLAELSEEERTLIDVAAVDGVVFDGEAVAAVVGEPVLAVLRRLQRLYRATGLIVPGERGYRFASAVFQEVVYDDLAPELRRQIHLDLARHLEGRPEAERVDPERIGLHWERAGRAEQAAPYLLRAARRAADRQEAGRAIDLARRGGLAPDPLDADAALGHAELVLALADAYYGSGRPGEADDFATRLVEAAQAAGDETLRLRGVVCRDYYRYFRRGVEAVSTEQLERAAESLPLCKEKGRARHLLGIIAKYRGDLHAAQRWLRDSDEVFRALALDAMHSSTVHELASVAYRAGRVREAEDLYLHAASISDHAGRKPNAAASRVNAALAALRRGALDGLADRLHRSVMELAVLGRRHQAAHTQTILARVAYACGDLAVAQATVDEALQTLEELEYLPGLMAARYVKALLCGVAGRLGEADLQLSLARKDAERERASMNVARIHALEAEHALWRGEAELAGKIARGAVDLAVASTSPGGEAMLKVAECVLFGLEPLPLPAGGSSEGSADPSWELASALLPAAAAASDPAAGADAIEAGAAALRRRPLGDERAALLVMASYLEALALGREGKRADALAGLAEAGAAAERLGHVWLVAAVLRARRRLGDSPAALTRHLDSLVAGAGVEEDPSRFLAAWE